MYEQYETGILTSSQINTFTDFLDKEIGTEYEVNEMDLNELYIIILDLTQEDVKKIRKMEKEITN